MLEGMTGFSCVQGTVRGVNIEIEVRSYNHRSLDIVINLSNGLSSVLEERMRRLIKEHFLRGRILLNLRLHNYPAEKVAINDSLINEYLENIHQLSTRFKLREDLSLKDVISLPGVLSFKKSDPIEQKYLTSIERLAKRALSQLKNIRVAEGRSILRDFVLRLKTISRQISAIKRYAEKIVERKRRLLNKDEFAAYIKNVDISEELLRLRLHSRNFHNLLTKLSIQGKGKELDFIAQELQREANTISAKSQYYKISQAVVKIKSEIEKIREQVQNIQ